MGNPAPKQGARNRASIRVMEMLGMTFDGRFVHDGVDVVRYATANPSHTAVG